MKRKSTIQTCNPNFKINGKLFKSLVHFNSNFKKDHLDPELVRFLINWFDRKDYINVSTSGTTGDPKKIKILKTAMINSAKKSAQIFGLKEKDRSLLCLPVKYIAGKMMVIRSLIIGLNMCTIKPNGSPLTRSSESYDFAAMVPSQVKKTIEHLNKVKKLLIGGAPVHKSLIELINTKFTEVYETFGMTETVSHIAIKNLSKGEKHFSAVPGATFGLKSGCLIISAPDLNKNTIVTNDIVELIDDKSFFWKGRKDSVINCGGVKYFPELLEKKVVNFKNIRFIICGIPDPILIEKIVIVFEKCIPPNVKRMFESLSVYEKPKLIFTLEKFTLKNGKIDRKNIRERVLKIKNETARKRNI